MDHEATRGGEMVPMPGTDDPLAWAIWYGRRGWQVFPLWPGQKTPLTEHGFHDASADERVICAWWSRWPDANVGLTMRSSGLLGIDIDSHRAEANGHETLAKLEAENGPLPDTVEAVTPGGIAGGRHLLLQHPGTSLTSSRDVLGPGIDVLDNAYMVAPPSIHACGKRYAWRAGHEPNAIEPAVLPQWLLEKLTPNEEPRTGLSVDDPDTPINRILRLLPDAHPAGRGWKALCPAHDDHDPSLSISEAEDGRVLMKCFAGCAAVDVARALGIEMRDLFPTLKVVGGNGKRLRAAGIRPDARNTLVSAPFSDLGNAERLQALYGDGIRYCLERDWFVWNGSIWEQDPGPLVPALAAETARRTLRTAADLADEEQRNNLAKHALKFESVQRVHAAASLAQGFPDLQVKAVDLDSDPWILNTPSGLVDLRTGELRPHDPTRLCTKITGAPYEPGTDCPRWEEFLLEVFQQDVDLVLFMQRAFGYALTGDTSEQVLFFLWGAGANGKTVLLEALRFVLGTYARTAPMALWLSDRNEHANAATPDLAALKGARFVTSIESNAERRLNEGLVKGVAGGDRVAARELFGRPFEFDFEGKVFCASNHRPVIKGADEGIWRRFLLVPFTRTFAPEERDKHLLEKLKGEASGILRWGVDGCLTLQRRGLQPPKQVRIASTEYREEQDPLGVWITERCTQDPSTASPTGDLYRDFSEWAEQSNEEAMTAEAFGKALGNRGFASQRTKKTRLRKGLALLGREVQTTLEGSGGGDG
jgi:putative DNA primase/helicase